MTTNEERIEIGKLEKTLARWFHYAFIDMDIIPT